jgi:DNA-binding CsgD family transcriptional regulator
LTVREKEFLKLVCNEKEYTYDQIADLMKVQHRTVDGYRESVFEKFGIKSKTGLVLFVLKHNLFELL